VCVEPFRINYYAGVSLGSKVDQAVNLYIVKSSKWQGP